MVRAFMVDVPQSLLDERRRSGVDQFDEVWDGVLHMPPMPSGWHQDLGSELIAIFRPVAKARGLVATYETNFVHPDKGLGDYRVPDLVVTTPTQRVPLGVQGAELVVELLSPCDESYEKLPFYEARGVKEVLVVNPETRGVELFVLRGQKLHAALPDEKGVLRSSVLGVAFATIAGPKLRVTWADGEVEV